MTDNTIPIEEAIRAYRDRPSMEAELQALRSDARIDMVKTHDLKQQLAEKVRELDKKNFEYNCSVLVDRDKLQRYEAALKATALEAAIKFRGTCGCDDCPPVKQQVENITAEFNEWWAARAALNGEGEGKMVRKLWT